MEYVFAASFEPDPEGGYLVTFPDVPEAITSGATIAEATANAAQALGLALRGIVALGRPLPSAAARGKNLHPISIRPDVAMKLALVEAFRQSGISRTELATRLGKAESEARRILDPDHPTKLATMHAALAALGKTVVISVHNAA